MQNNIETVQVYKALPRQRGGLTGRRLCGEEECVQKFSPHRTGDLCRLSVHMLLWFKAVRAPSKIIIPNFNPLRVRVIAVSFINCVSSLVWRREAGRGERREEEKPESAAVSCAASAAEDFYCQARSIRGKNISAMKNSTRPQNLGLHTFAVYQHHGRHSHSARRAGRK